FRRVLFRSRARANLEQARDQAPPEQARQYQEKIEELKQRSADFENQRQQICDSKVQQAEEQKRSLEAMADRHRQDLEKLQQQQQQQLQEQTLAERAAQEEALREQQRQELEERLRQQELQRNR